MNHANTKVQFVDYVYHTPKLQVFWLKLFKPNLFNLKVKQSMDCSGEIHFKHKLTYYKYTYIGIIFYG